MVYPPLTWFSQNQSHLLLCCYFIVVVEGLDYVATSVQLETNLSVSTFDILNDGLIEGDEFFTITILDTGLYEVGNQSTATVRIIDYEGNSMRNIVMFW